MFTILWALLILAAVLFLGAYRVSNVLMHNSSVTDRPDKSYASYKRVASYVDVEPPKMPPPKY